MGDQTGPRMMRGSSVGSNRGGREQGRQLLVRTARMAAATHIDGRGNRPLKDGIVDRSAYLRARYDLDLMVAFAGYPKRCQTKQRES